VKKTVKARSLFFKLSASLLCSSPASSEQISAWIVLRDETVLEGRRACEASKICDIRLDEYTKISVGYDNNWENLMIALDIKDPFSTRECCEFAQTQDEYLIIRRPRNYLKKYIYYREPAGVFIEKDRRYGTIYLRIED
jgi:hypothetical protein